MAIGHCQTETALLDIVRRLGIFIMTTTRPGQASVLACLPVRVSIVQPCEKFKFIIGSSNVWNWTNNATSKTEAAKFKRMGKRARKIERQVKGNGRGKLVDAAKAVAAAAAAAALIAYQCQQLKMIKPTARSVCWVARACALRRQLCEPTSCVCVCLNARRSNSVYLVCEIVIYEKFNGND